MPPYKNIEEKLNYRFKDPQLLQLALTHRSYWNEHQALVSSYNERLEFLGDSVLGLVVAQYLYRNYPQKDEGILSSIRAQLVNASACIEYIQQLKLEEDLLLGKGEVQNKGKGRESILANLFEALMAAIYLDQGLEAATHFFISHFKYHLDRVLSTPLRNCKGEFQDYIQKYFHKTPFYEVMEERGPSHQKEFVIRVRVGDEVWGQGRGSSKKEAQMAAAKEALQKLEEEGKI